MVLKIHGTKYHCHWNFSRFMMHFIIMISVLVLLISYISNIAKATIPRKEMTVIVHHGDTLWSLAQKIEPNKDPRQVIRDIKIRNNLQTSELFAGQKLKLVCGGD